MSRIEGIIRSNPKIRGNMNPAPDWEIVGKHNGRVVYRERIPNHKPVPQKDASGNVVMIKDHATGMDVRPRLVMQRDQEEPFIYREFQLADLGNGIVKKNYHFRGPEVEIQPTREEVLEAEVATLRQQMDALIASANQKVEAGGALSSEKTEAPPADAMRPTKELKGVPDEELNDAELARRNKNRDRMAKARAARKT